MEQRFVFSASPLPARVASAEDPPKISQPFFEEHPDKDADISIDLNSSMDNDVSFAAVTLPPGSPSRSTARWRRSQTAEPALTLDMLPNSIV
jgi:hypothetical protein